MIFAIRPILRSASRAGGMMALLLAAAGTRAEPQQAAPPRMTVLAFSSALTLYKSYTEQPVTSWREANDTVSRFGGWRGYAKETSQETSLTAASEAGAAHAPAGHDEDHDSAHGGQP